MKCCTGMNGNGCSKLTYELKTEEEFYRLKGSAGFEAIGIGRDWGLKSGCKGVQDLKGI